MVLLLYNQCSDKINTPSLQSKLPELSTEHQANAIQYITCLGLQTFPQHPWFRKWNEKRYFQPLSIIHNRHINFKLWNIKFACDWVVRKKQKLCESGPQAQCKYDEPDQRGLGIRLGLGRDWAEWNKSDVWTSLLYLGCSSHELP
jgi:hypothetical protein